MTEGAAYAVANAIEGLQRAVAGLTAAVLLDPSRMRVDEEDMDRAVRLAHLLIEWRGKRDA